MAKHETTLPALLRKRAMESPDRTYVTDIEDRALSYRQTEALMDRWASAYRQAGVQRGEIVVTMQFNTIEAMAGWLGLTSIGAIEAPLNTDYRGALLSHALNTTRATTMVLARQFVDRVVEVAADLLHLKRLIVLDAETSLDGLGFDCLSEAQFLGAAKGSADPFEPAPWDIGAILFTSGTTGPSKAVQMPWRQIFATTVATLPIEDLGPQDVIFNAGPTYHVGAKVFPFLAALIGGRHVIRPFISESRMPDEYRKHGVTTCFYPPLVWLDEPPRADDADCALRNLLLPLAVPRMGEFKQRFGCRTYSLYSMTELSCPLADPDWDIGRVNEEGLFSCGVVRPGFPGYEARIVDEWDQPVGPGVVGELVVRTSEPWAINAGYLNNPEQTAAAWRNGWFHTGDAFSRDADGYFYFRDRVKDCIRRRGENISSFEVESGVRKHPEVADCAVVAQKLIESPGADEEIRLIVVRAPELSLKAEALVRWLIPRMPRFMIPRFVEFIDVLPRTPTLKVQKALLRGRPLDQGVWDRERSGLELPLLMVRKLLIANRGEIAVRIARTAIDMGVKTVSVFSQDDANSLHTRATDEIVALRGAGVAPYLDIDQVIQAAVGTDCDSVHPGYGFLAENPEFASRCATAGLTFVGPTGDQLRQFGDKARARALAESCGVPVLPGARGRTTLAEARAFLEGLGEGASIMVKAIAGGGGHGIRRVDRADQLQGAYDLCQSESLRAFGDDGLYVEQFVRRARHLEVQVLGDAFGAVTHLWDRECSLQRQHQKLIEIAPAIGISEALRERLLEAATTIARSVRFQNLGTFEFLVDQSAPDAEAFYFMEANPRLQVEHTVTEAVTGLDLVRLQLGVAAGRSLADLGVSQADIPRPKGLALQARVNMETVLADGAVRPASGTLAVYEAPSGPGVRVDGFGYAGYRTSTRFDSLLAKVIVQIGEGSLADLMRKTARVLAEFKIVGVSTNLPFLMRIVAMPDVGEGRFYTRFLEDHRAALAQGDVDAVPARFFEPRRGPRRAGARIDKADPLAILDRDLAASTGPEDRDAAPMDHTAPEGCLPIRAPLQGTVVSISVALGEAVLAGAPVLVMEAMKMEHVVVSDHAGIVREFVVGAGDAVYEAAVLAFIEPQDVAGLKAVEAEIEDIDFVRADLAELHQRRTLRADAGRLEQVERRHARGQRTPRENIADLCDPGSFVEFGGLAVAARRQRHTVDELIRNTPADGFIMGTARVNGDRFADDRARCAVMAYDPTVLAGTQGMKGHEKLDRMLELAAKSRLPVVFFTEGGGGRPGDTDKLGVGYNFIRTFSLLGQLSGLVPLVGVTNSRCFAGNAFILGCCDVVIATRNSTIGIAGPALIEGAGLGAYTPEEIGPVSLQGPNGVIDVLVDDEAAAVAAAKQYLAYFQGSVSGWSHADQRLLRGVIPEKRRRVYDMRKLIRILADTDTVLELRPQFGNAIITALIRIEGRPIGVIANNPHHLGGAIDSAGSDKATRFMQLCEAYRLPILSLCDTPGYMVGPEAEKTALIRHCARMIVVGSNLTTPIIAIVIRKGYGLGGLAMAGGSFSNCVMTAAWPTGEFGGMALEGFVKLGFRDQLAAIADVDERQAKYEQMVAQLYEEGKALNAATFYEFDDVIDPMDTRSCIVEALRSTPEPQRRDGKTLPWVDTW